MVKELCVLLTRCEVRTRECGPAVNSSNRAQLGLCDEEFPPPHPTLIWPRAGLFNAKLIARLTLFATIPLSQVKRHHKVQARNFGSTAVLFT